MCFWCSWGAFTSYATAFFKASGMSATMIGVALAINIAFAIAGQFFWGYICDRLKTNKKVFMAVTLVVAAIYFAIFYSPSNIVAIALFGFLGFIHAPLITIMDTWILKYYHDSPGSYGPIRAWGSVAFAIFIVIYGELLNRYGFSIMPYTGLAFFSLIILFSYITPDVPEQSDDRVKATKGDILRLVKNPGFVWYIVIIFMISLPAMQLQNSFPMILSEYENAIFYMGVGMFATSMAEVPFMMMAKKMAHITANKRFIIAVSLFIFSYVILLFNRSPVFLIISLVIHGASVGIRYPTMRQATYEISPDGLQNTTQGIVGVSLSMSGIASNMIMGGTLDMGGILLLVTVNIAIQVLSLGLLFYRTYLVRPRNR